MKHKCLKCGSEKFYFVDTVNADGSSHLKCSCAECDQFLRFFPKPVKDTELGSVTMPFGKHKGIAFKDLPLDYLKWVGENVDSGIGPKAKEFVKSMSHG